MISAEAPRTNARFICNRGKASQSVPEWTQFFPDVVKTWFLTLLTIVLAKDSWFTVEALLSSISTGTKPIHGSCPLVPSSPFPRLVCVSLSWTWRHNTRLKVREPVGSAVNYPCCGLWVGVNWKLSCRLAGGAVRFWQQWNKGYTKTNMFNAWLYITFDTKWVSNLDYGLGRHSKLTIHRPWFDMLHATLIHRNSY